MEGFLFVCDPCGEDHTRIDEAFLRIYLPGSLTEEGRIICVIPYIEYTELHISHENYYEARIFLQALSTSIDALLLDEDAKTDYTRYRANSDAVRYISADPAYC